MTPREPFRTIMKNYCVLVLLVTLLATGKEVVCQENTNPKTDAEVFAVAKEIMNAAKTCALITIDKEGRPRVRTMDPFAPEEDLSVWLGTNADSRKVMQIKNDPRVTLYYLDKDETGYVMVHGTAKLVNSEHEKTKRWKTKWEAFYRNNRENYRLIHVTPQWIEVSSAPRGLHGDAKTWQPATIILDPKQ